MDHKGWTVLAVLVGVVGIALIAVGGGMIPYFNTEIKEKPEKRALLTNVSDSFNQWLNGSDVTTSSWFQSFFLFNVTNPDEATKTGANVTVKEIGPFVYRISQTPVNLTFSSDQTYLTYDLLRSYTFMKNLSFSDEMTQKVTVVNLPIMSLLSKLRYLNNTENITWVSETLQNQSEKVFKEVLVADILWGYTNPTVNFTNTKLPNLHLYKDPAMGIFYESNQMINITMAWRRMGHYKISTGSDEISKVWKIAEYNNDNVVPYCEWSGHAGDINGTAGYDWHPRIDSSKRLYQYDPDWFRSVYLSHESQTMCGDGHVNLTTGRFVLDATVLDTLRSENRGFCNPTPEGEPCLGKGVINTTMCNTEREEVPLILSQPHFYDASEKYINEIIGLKPDKKKHENEMDVETTTGEVVEANYRKQYNLYVTNVDSRIFNLTEKFNGTLIPVAWTQEEYSMSERERKQIKDFLDKLNSDREMFDGIQYGLIGVGVLILLILFVVVVIVVKMRARRGDGDDPLIQA